MIYMHLDADNIGSIIELYLLDGNLEAAISFSKRVCDGMDYLCEELEDGRDSVVKMMGGDDLIMEMTLAKYQNMNINRIRSNFKKATGATISIGVGVSVKEALENLRRAKLMGKDRVVTTIKETMR